MSSEKKKKWIRRLKGLLFLVFVGICLQNIPGSYTIDDFQDDYEVNSPEGIALLALSDVTVNAEIFFKEKARHRINRHAEIVVPAGVTLKASASAVPFVEGDEVVARPKTLELTSDKPLTFIYRNVTLATAKRLAIDPEDPTEKVKVIGKYKVLTALATLHRYKRQKAVKRDYKVPSSTTLSIQAHVLPNHKITTPQGYSLDTGPQPGLLSVKDAVWNQGRWQAGYLSLSLHFSDLNPLIDQLVERLFPKEFELGKRFKVKVLRIYNLSLSQNFVRLYVDGTLTSATSSWVSHIFNPSFQTQLGVQFIFPENTLLSEAEATIQLKNIFSLDFNRSNILFDKYARGVARSYRQKASKTWDLSEEFSVLTELPGTVYMDRFQLNGDEQGHSSLDVQLRVLSSENPTSLKTPAE